MSGSQTQQIKVQTDLNILSEILAWFEQLYEPQIPQHIWLRCKLALAEGFTNAVRHAHKNQPSEVPIEIEVALSHQMVQIRIWDYGPPFDLVEKLRQMPKDKDNETAGGRGIQLIEKISDRFSYTRTPDNRNCLLIVKSYGGENGSNQRKTTDFS